jgi:hypothetical protein
VAPDDALYMMTKSDRRCVLLDPISHEAIGGKYFLFWRANDARGEQYASLATDLQLAEER